MRSAGRREQRGQTLVIVALGMVAFFGFLGLALDGASAYLAQQDLQRDADLAAISGTWAYYHDAYQQSDTYGSVVSGMAAANQAVDTSLAANGYSGAPRTVTAINAAGTEVDTSGCPTPGPTCPQDGEVRGVRVHLSKVLPTQILQSVGVGNPTIAATAGAELGPNTGARHEVPLLVQNFNAAQSLPRVTAYGPGGCDPAPGDGVRYPLGPGCRPSTRGTWPDGQLLSLEPAWGGGAHPELGAWAAAPKTSFFLLHDPATTEAPANSPSQGVITSGLDEFLPTCAPGCAGAAPVFADINAPGSDAAVEAGISARIATAAQAGGKWEFQKCAQPHDPANPLTPDNPRLLRLPVTYNTGSGNSTSDPGVVGAFFVSETLMFCVDSVPTGGGSYALSGYLVEVPSSEPTVLRPGDVYFGRDVVVKLVS